jgi:hypothetical protein
MGHVFVGDILGNVSALNVKDGTPVWSKSVKLPFAISVGLAISKDEKALYVGGASGVYALSTSNGNVLWVHSMGSPVTGAVAVDTNGNIYACADGGKIAVRGTRWRGMGWCVHVGGKGVRRAYGVYLLPCVDAGAPTGAPCAPPPRAPCASTASTGFSCVGRFAVGLLV